MEFTTTLRSSAESSSTFYTVPMSTADRNLTSLFFPPELNSETVGNSEISYPPSQLITLLEGTNDYLSFREQQVRALKNKQTGEQTLNPF